MILLIAYKAWATLRMSDKVQNHLADINIDIHFTSYSGFLDKCFIEIDHT